jgi:hypothetical protein
MTATYDLIASNVLTSSAITVEFTSIGSSYRDLVLVVEAIDGPSTNSPFVTITFNSDSAENYYIVSMYGDGSTASSTSGSDFSINASAGSIVGVNNRGLFIVQIMDYAQSKHKPVLIRGNSSFGAAATAARWASTSAIISVKLDAFSPAQFGAGSSFYLYGIVA